MRFSAWLRPFFAALGIAAYAFSVSPASAQSGNVDAQKQQKPADTAKDQQKSINEIAEAAKAINGPAGNPECVWLGRRVVSLMWRDDLDTAFRHLSLYDRFDCPGSHIQAAFRCVVRQGHIDPKAQESLNSRVHGCWLNPALEPVLSAATPAKPAAAGGTPKP
jgi:hypothetical protein